MKCMKDRCFLDTNILIYPWDESDPYKKQVSSNFLTHINKRNEPIISTQTLGEFFNVAYRKLGFSKDDAIIEVQRIASIYPVYEITKENVFHAMQISKTTQFSYWDSLIIAMAIDTDCSVLYSEDLNPCQQIEGVRIINPFTSEG